MEKLEEHVYKDMDNISKVRYIFSGIKYGALISVKYTILESAPYCKDYYGSVILYKDYINQAQDTNVGLNISGVCTGADKS